MVSRHAGVPRDETCALHRDSATPAGEPCDT